MKKKNSMFSRAITTLGVALSLPATALAGDVATSYVNDLVGYWDFNEVDTAFQAPNQASAVTSGTATLAEFAGNDDPSWTLGPLCGHVELTGAADQYFTISDVGAGLNGATSITVMCWFKPTALPGTGNPAGLIQSRSVEDNVGANRLYGLDYTEFRELDGRVSNQAARSPADSAALNQWHHAAIVYDGVNRITYLNGVAVATEAQTDVTGIVSGGAWVVGVDPSNLTGRLFTGAIDDVAIFKTAIDATTMASIAAKNAAGNPAQALPGIVDPAFSLIVNPDGDGDTMCDTWETFYFGDTETSDGTTSTGDTDTLTDAAELNIHLTDPTTEDTDADGVNDDDEVNGTLNPYKEGHVAGNAPGGVPGAPTNPFSDDSDGDGVLDDEEIVTGVDGFITNPNAADTDGDGFSDFDEANGSLSDPTNAADFPDFYPNLVGYWPFDNSTGLVATQKSAFDAGGALAASDATWQSSTPPQWVLSQTPGDGICGYVNLNGSSGRFFTATIPGLQGTAPKFTLTGWVRLTGSGGGTGYRGLFMTRDVDEDVDTAQNFGFAVETGGNRIDARVSGQAVDGQGGLAIGTWRHVAMVYDGTNSTIYLDGVQDATGATAAVAEIVRSGSWSFGEDNNRRVAADLDDFAAFNTALPGSLIKSIYDAGVAGNNLLTVFSSAPAALAQDDADEDGICDQWEIDFFGNITTSDFSEGTDTDGDTLDDIDEILTYGTDPNDDDTDDDNLKDGDEVDGTLNPFVNGVNTGTPGDATDPFDSDSDNDGISDGDELASTGTIMIDATSYPNNFITNPNATDTDTDGVSDSQEFVDGTDPTDPQDLLLPQITGTVVLYYNFDEGTGATALDRAQADGIQSASQAQGTVAWTTVNQLMGSAALDLDGGTSLTTTGFLPASAPAFTISVWFNPDVIPDYDGVFVHRPSNWGIAQNDTQLDNRIAGSGFQTDVGTIAVNQWYHVAVTWDNTGAQSVFVNGAKLISRTDAPTTYDATGVWSVGDDTCCGGRELNAQMDDLAVFSTVVSDADIKAIADAGHAGFALPRLFADGGGITIDPEPSAPIQITDIAESGSDVVLTLPTPAAGKAWQLLSTTDLTLAIGSWTEEAAATTATSFTDTNALDSTLGDVKRFYVIIEVDAVPVS